LFAVLAVVLATVSAAAGSAMSYRPAANQVAPAQPAPQDVVLAQLASEHRCLSQAIYYEARGEGRRGQQAVAEVVFHRMNAGNHGHSICAVVYDGSSHRGCQFSFTCNGDLQRPREASAWNISEQLAAQILTGEVPLRNATGGATNYHSVSVSPYWAPTLERTTQIGNHIFYRGAGHTRASRGPPQSLSRTAFECGATARPTARTMSAARSCAKASAAMAPA
jgi:spore germination cell wall hydrolase CwlJ-like protein